MGQICLLRLRTDQPWNSHLKLVLQLVKVGGGEKDSFLILANSTTWNAKPCYDITNTNVFKALINLSFILVAAKLSSHGRGTGISICCSDCADNHIYVVVCTILTTCIHN